MKVWDVMGGFTELHSLSNHAKTVTCLAADKEGTRLLSASLDGHVKVYDLQVGPPPPHTHTYIHHSLCGRAGLVLVCISAMPCGPAGLSPPDVLLASVVAVTPPQNYEVIHSLRLAGALLSVGLSPDKNRLVVGRADGSVSIRSREKKKAEPSSSQLRLNKPIFGGTARHFNRGKNAVAGAGDFQVGRQAGRPHGNAEDGGGSGLHAVISLAAPRADGGLCRAL